MYLNDYKTQNAEINACRRNFHHLNHVFSNEELVETKIELTEPVFSTVYKFTDSGSLVQHF